MDYLLYLQDKSLYETYTHTHKGTFVRTVENNGFKIERLQKEMKTLINKVIREVKDRLILIEGFEDSFIEDYKAAAGLNSLDKDVFLFLLNKEFLNNSDNPAFQKWGEIKSLIKKESSMTKKTNKVEEKKAIGLFQKRIKDIGKSYNIYLEEYDKLITNSTKEKDVDSSQYKKSIQNLKNFVDKFENPPKNRKELNKLFKSAIKSTIDLGWTIEPLTRTFIKEIFESKIVGKELMDKQTVIDLQIILNNKSTSYGVNVKSQAEKYTIGRSNFKGQGRLEFKYYKKELSYLRRNLGALKRYSFDFEDDKDVNQFNSIYNKFYKLERELAFYGNLISAIDGLNQEYHSILISFQGGFLWTSDVLRLILDDLKSGKKPEIITYRVKTWDSKTHTPALKQLWSNKKKIIRNTKKEITYSELSNAKPQIKGQDSLVYYIHYTINLANAKSKSGGQ